MKYCKNFFWELTINKIVFSRYIGYRLRTFILKCIGIDISIHSAIYSGCFLAGKRIHLGHGSYINRNCYLENQNAEIWIGRNVGVAPCVQIYTTNHNYLNSEKRTGSVIPKTVRINDGVWIGGGSIICPGVTIGQGCVVAAGSIVTKDCMDNGLYAGNPARLVRILDQNY